jgi:hypothetical protein
MASVAVRKIDRYFQPFPSLRSELHEPRADAMLLREIASTYAVIAGWWMSRFWCSSERTPIIRRFVG